MLPRSKFDHDMTTSDALCQTLVALRLFGEVNIMHFYVFLPSKINITYPFESVVKSICVKIKMKSVSYRIGLKIIWHGNKIEFGHYSSIWGRRFQRLFRYFNWVLFSSRCLPVVIHGLIKNNDLGDVNDVYPICRRFYSICPEMQF